MRIGQSRQGQQRTQTARTATTNPFSAAIHSILYMVSRLLRASVLRPRSPVGRTITGRHSAEKYSFPA